MCVDYKNVTQLGRKENAGKERKEHSLRFIFYSIMEPILFWRKVLYCYIILNAARLHFLNSRKVHST